VDNNRAKKGKEILIMKRRDFIKLSGVAVVGVCFNGCDIGPIGKEKATWGFLLADVKKCQGCLSCMLACSLAHEGAQNLSLSRIQILQNSFGKFPDDITLVQCRQCVEPACVSVCPTGALQPDPDFGNVTTVDVSKCIGCKRCVNACPYTPGRTIWNVIDNHSQKCDLCANTPYWDQTGGPEGKKACVEVCPMGALTFTLVIPDQESIDSYNVNLRDLEWYKLGFPIF